MRKITVLFMVIFIAGCYSNGYAQEDQVQRQIKKLERQKETVSKREKNALKDEVKSINERLERGLITESEAKILKEEAARKRAKNIENCRQSEENK